MNVCSNGKLNTTKLGTATEKLAFECNKSFSGATTNLRQQNNLCLTSGVIFVTIPYCTSYYLPHQEFLTVSAYL